MCRLHTAFPLAWVWPQAQYTSLRHTQSTSVQRGRQQGHPHTNTHICTQAACCLPWTTHKQAGLQGRQHLTANERLASWEPTGKQRQTACVYIYIPFHFFFCSGQITAASLPCRHGNKWTSSRGHLLVCYTEEQRRCYKYESMGCSTVMTLNEVFIKL